MALWFAPNGTFSQDLVIIYVYFNLLFYLTGEDNGITYLPRAFSLRNNYTKSAAI